MRGARRLLGAFTLLVAVGLTVTATDLAGSEATQTPRRAGDPEPCAAQAATVIPSAVPPLDPRAATRTLEARLPEALGEWSRVTLAGTAIRPRLEATAAGFRAFGTIAPFSLDRRASDGVTTGVRTDTAPICATPTAVARDASPPASVLRDTAALYANVLGATDALIRPTPAGVASVLQLRGRRAPERFGWHVDLQRGQQLKALGDGSVAVVEPVPAGSEIVTTGFAPPAEPPVADRIAAMDDTELYLKQATGALERALEQTPDEIVAVIPKPWARDANDRPLATTLSAAGSTLKMHVSHALPSTAYPAVAGTDTIVADSLDEWETLRSEADTAESTDAEPQPGLRKTPLPAPVDDLPDAGFNTDPATTADPSAFEDLDLDGGEEPAETQAAEPGTAAGRIRPLRARVALTGTFPAQLYSPDRIRLGARSVRPIVPWRVTQMIRRPNRHLSRPQRDAERQRGFLWDSRTTSGAPKGFFTVAETPSAGDKSPFERANGVTTDVVLQFSQVDYAVNGVKVIKRDARAPRLADYKRMLREFLTDYKWAMLKGDGTPIGTLTPWNEPQLRSNPTAKDPIRAARFWRAARALCHPRNGPQRCGEVIAGEYAGTTRDQMIRYRGAKRSYQDIYETYLLNRRPRPRVWGFHTYDDANRYQRGLKGSAKWPITSRYYRRFRSARFKAGGARARAWVTGTGAFYHRDCGKATGALYQTRCAVAGPAPDKRSVLFGMRGQSNTVAAMMRKIARDLPSIGRLYYFNLHATEDASHYGGPSFVEGGGPLRYDSGLLGADNDGGYENGATVARYPGARGFSDPGERRLAFCTLRGRILARNRPRRCR